MNRLIIIGNGFDLAHGLPTSYRNFIDDYWASITSFIHEDEFIKLNVNIKPIYPNNETKSYQELISYMKTKVSSQGEYDHFLNVYKNKITYKKPKSFSGVRDEAAFLEFKNDFFCLINNKNSENWVDIENEYYRQLKETLKKSPSQNKKDQEYFEEKQKEQVVKLNQEFEQVKALLEKYLYDKIESKYNFQPGSNKDFIDIFNENFYDGKSLERFYDELPSVDVKEIEADFDKKVEEQPLLFKNHEKKLTLENHFLSFNYTKTIPLYLQYLDMKPQFINEIHGSLNDEKNPINFGFGDEKDKDYQEIEEIDDNEYLKNMKSFQYLHTSNYKRLLDLIDSDKFQVYIMGHSCGLSDRTLLNTIFEHKNCRSIKVFYYQIKDKQGNVKYDNYTEITQNISRHFNDKKIMREKIVNKTLCEPLPQLPKN